MIDLARQLQFGAEQALCDGRGLLAELYGLQLQSCLHAECSSGDPGSAGPSGAAAAQLECALLVARGDATQEAAQHRCTYESLNVEGVTSSTQWAQPACNPAAIFCERL
jgi:hypothetical protein